jgi:hypothetical protein
MANFRARSCPNCNYYLAFSVSNPAAKPKETTVTSFCLNCGYKIPIQSVIRGIRRATSPVRRGLLRLAKTNPSERAGANGEPPQTGTRETPIDPAEYARHLRAIGQDLENLRLTRFNLECTGSVYLIWPRSDTIDSQPRPSLLANRRLRRLWHNRIEPRPQGREEYVTVNPLRHIKRYRYTTYEIDKIDKAGQSRRCLNGTSDGHSLSQLLRTIGGLIRQRNQKLLAIAWQELSVSVVFESDRGRREIDVFRLDHLYDLWVRMYLRRNNRVLSDLPR